MLQRACKTVGSAPDISLVMSNYHNIGLESDGTKSASAVAHTLVRYKISCVEGGRQDKNIWFFKNSYLYKHVFKICFTQKAKNTSDQVVFQTKMLLIQDHHQQERFHQSTAANKPYADPTITTLTITASVTRKDSQ